MRPRCSPLPISTNRLEAWERDICYLPMRVASDTEVVIIGGTSTSCGPLHAC